MRGKKGRNYAIHETGLSGNVVASFFPLIIFILLCFNVLSTVPRENRLADFLYIYIYIYFFFLICLKSIRDCGILCWYAKGKWLPPRRSISINNIN